MWVNPSSAATLRCAGNSDSLHQLGILVDTDGHYANPNLLDRYLMQPSILRAFGWRFALVLTKDWYHNPDDVLSRSRSCCKARKCWRNPTLKTKNLLNHHLRCFRNDGRNRAHLRLCRFRNRLQSIQPPPVLASVFTPGSVRHFEFTGGTSRKFWDISLSGNARSPFGFGRIGTAGQSQTKTFADEAKAKREADHLIAEKLKKGYVE